MSLSLMSHVVFKNWPCRAVEFKNCPCRPVEFRGDEPLHCSPCPATSSSEPDGADGELEADAVLMIGTHEFMSEHIYLNNGYCYFRFNRVVAVLFPFPKERTVASLLPNMSFQPTRICNQTRFSPA